MKLRKLRNKYWKSLLIVEIEDIKIGTLTKRVLSFYKDGSEISEEDYHSLKDEIKKYSWERYLKFLAYRERTESESRNFLAKFYISSSLIEHLIEKAKHYNYLNDNRFVEMFIESLKGRYASINAIENKLKEKGVSESLIAKEISKIDYQYAEKALKKQLEKAEKKYRNISKEKKYEKTFSYLYRKGFSTEDIRQMLKI